MVATNRYRQVASSNVDAVRYLRNWRVLYIRFKNGSTYRYDGVPFAVWEGLLSAPSKGGYVWRVIRNNGADDLYPHRKLGATAPRSR